MIDGQRLGRMLQAQPGPQEEPVVGIARAMLDKPGATLHEAATSGHVYLRLEKSVDEEPAGYPAAALDHWAERLKAIAGQGQDVFAYVISGAKHRAPAAAMALIERL